MGLDESIVESVVGQSRHFDRARLTTGLTLSTDILGVFRNVGFVPNCDMRGDPTQVSTPVSGRPPIRRGQAN
jgi:hypothetical protein